MDYPIAILIGELEQYARTKFWIDSQVSSTTNDTVMQIKLNEQVNSECKQQMAHCFANPKYKNQIMEKYLRGLDNTQDSKGKCGLELSKWLESAAKFTPDKNNYIEWESKK